MAIRPYVGEEALRELVRQIKQHTASVYIVKGSIGVCTYDESTQQYVHTPANLPYYIWGSGQGPSAWKEFAYVVDSSDNPVALQKGWVFNLAVDYTVTTETSMPSPFIDRERGEVIKAGTNICIVNVGTAENPVYKYDCLATDVDLTPYQTKKLTDNALVHDILNNIKSSVYTHASYAPSNYPDKPATSAFLNEVAFVRNTSPMTGAEVASFFYYSDGVDWVLLASKQSTPDYAIADACTVEQMLACIAAYTKNVKQNKNLSSALTMLTPDFTYATVAAMPTTGATAEGIETGDIAYVTETAKLYQATVDGSDNITWAEIGDQTTVEGAIKLLGSLAPNRPVTAAEVQTLFNS